MMDCNWLVQVAINDRKTLRSLGGDDAAMSHDEVVAELRRLGYSWKLKRVVCAA